ncbi:putative immunity protein [Planococcus sp. FY231025]|uniref:putative immunity protein n=1 Tax=Planococcus sp. FY231025 TaxID=3455699 RepID=UPI003F92838C
MRDIRFVAVHRGGTLTKENHQRLMHWARVCAEHILQVLGEEADPRLAHALDTAEKWEQGEVPTGDAMKAAVAAHAAAREKDNPASTAAARSVGHAVATAHMADHSVGAPLYALKALKLAGKPLHEEREWQLGQLRQLPSSLADQVLEAMRQKEKGFKL